jgi:hypothetical protein
MVGRVVDDGAALEAHDHSPGPKRVRRQLHGIQVDELEVLAGDRGIADLDDRDRGLFAADAALRHLRLHLLRNSDRRFA